MDNWKFTVQDMSAYLDNSNFKVNWLIILILFATLLLYNVIKRVFFKWKREEEESAWADVETPPAVAGFEERATSQGIWVASGN